jgi:hypothetical protein
LTILGGFCLHLVLGNAYLWGNISNYVISYFHYGNGDSNGDPQATQSISFVVLPIILLVQPLFAPVSAIL